jgi:hypothetical protein
MIWGMTLKLQNKQIENNGGRWKNGFSYHSRPASLSEVNDFIEMNKTFKTDVELLLNKLNCS